MVDLMPRSLAPAARDSPHTRYALVVLLLALLALVRHLLVASPYHRYRR